MIRNALFSTAAIAALASGPALAADLPSRAAPAPYVAPAPIFTWTGFYVGLNAGVGFNNGNNTPSATGAGFIVGIGAPGTVANPNAFVFSGNGSNRNRSSFTGGATVGYNWQSGALVYGIEADFDYLDRTRRNNGGTAPATVAFGQPFAVVNSSGGGGDFLGTLRGRVGYAADRALFFVTGGLAYGGGRRNTVVNYYNNLVAGGTVAGSALPAPSFVFGQSGGNSSKVGYTLGAGVEYAFTNNWTMKLEYDYINVGGRRGGSVLTTPGAAAFPVAPGFTQPVFNTNRRSNDLSRVIVGVNYKF